MPEPAHIHLTRTAVAATTGTLARREDAAERLGNLGLIEPDTGQVNPVEWVWLANINDSAPFPLAGFAAELVDGELHASLVLPLSAITTGTDNATPTVTPVVRPATPPKNERKVWGSPGPDPREQVVAGWDPTLAEQVANNAEVQA